MRHSSLRIFPVLAVFALVSLAEAANVIVQGTILQNTTWTSSNVYFLRGGVFVGDDVNQTILTIEPGTVIKGERAYAGFLCVRRHSKIIADGTESQPITFTSDQSVGQQARGDWGGIIINGLAHVNLTGGVGQGEGGTGPYGGGPNYNDADNSGTLRYVRVAYGGYPITPEDELNGIAFQGVGNGTIIDYVQVLMGGDDGIEMFGGAVNLRHCFSAGNLDDQFDWTFGWNGKAQFLVCQEYGDVGDHGFECDNNEFNYSALPRSNPTIYNITWVGDINPVGNPIGLLLRRGTAATIKNAIVMNFEDCGIDIDDAATFANAWDTTTQSLNGQLVVDYSIFYGNGDIAQLGETGTQNEANFPFTSPQFIQTLNPNNRFTSPTLTAPTDTLNPDFRPQAGSIAWTGYTQPPVDPFFSTVDYVGAFGNTDWTAGWRLTPTQGIVVQPLTLAAGWNLISLSVVPANNSLSALFPTAVVAYKYVPGTGYINSTTLENGKGYWINLPAATSAGISGTAFASYTTPVTPPWELLGGVISPNQVPTATGGNVNVVYYYNPGTGYVVSPGNMMQPGKGHWVNMTTGTTSISLGGTTNSPSPKEESFSLDETDEVWNLTLTATGNDTLGAPYVFNCVIGGGLSQFFIPSPPPPPTYATYPQLYSQAWGGPYSEMKYVWPPADSLFWRLEVDPNGNVPPPTQSRTTTISWNPANLPLTGDFRVLDASFGTVVVPNMRTQSSFTISGTQLKFYNIHFNPPPGPPVTVMLLPVSPPIIIPQQGGTFEWDITLHNNQTTPQTIDIWNVISGPVTRPGWGPFLNLTMSAGQTINRIRPQTIVDRYPAGAYTYTSNIGVYPDTVMDSDSFPFTKAAATDGWTTEQTAIELIPTEFALHGAVPNPFNPTATISFALPEASQVTLKVYDSAGREVASLVNGWREAGNHQVTFDGRGLASGVYIYRLTAGAFSATQKMILMK